MADVLTYRPGHRKALQHLRTAVRELLDAKQAFADTPGDPLEIEFSRLANISILGCAQTIGSLQEYLRQSLKRA